MTDQVDTATPTEPTAPIDPAAADPSAQVPADTQTAADSAAPASADPAKPADDKPAGAPDAYTFDAPEGVSLDATVMDAFSAAAKAANLPQDAAQSILASVAPVIAEQQRAAVEAVRTQWADEARADKEFGGDKLPENLAIAQSALRQFGDESLNTFLNESGLGNHPGVIRMLWKVGKAIGEDGFVKGGASTNQPRSAQQLYAASNMNP